MWLAIASASAFPGWTMKLKKRIVHFTPNIPGSNTEQLDPAACLASSFPSSRQTSHLAPRPVLALPRLPDWNCANSRASCSRHQPTAPRIRPRFFTLAAATQRLPGNDTLHTHAVTGPREQSLLYPLDLHKSHCCSARRKSGGFFFFCLLLVVFQVPSPNPTSAPTTDFCAKARSSRSLLST